MLLTLLGDYATARGAFKFLAVTASLAMAFVRMATCVAPVKDGVAPALLTVPEAAPVAMETAAMAFVPKNTCAAHSGATVEP